MALVKAVAAGAVAAVGMPYLFAGQETQIGAFVRSTTTRIPVGEAQIGWAWGVFAFVTLLAWGLLAWADR
jgi:hypothetical protein